MSSRLPKAWVFVALGYTALACAEAEPTTGNLGAGDMSSAGSPDALELGGAPAGAAGTAFGDTGNASVGGASTTGAGGSGFTGGSGSTASGGSTSGGGTTGAGGNPLCALFPCGGAGGAPAGAGGTLGAGGDAGGVAGVGGAGFCDNLICWDIFDCAIFHADRLSCNFTKCDGFVCKP
jgi:hypothetical protein